MITQPIFRRILIALPLAFAFITTAARAANEDDEEELPKFAPGLVATYRTGTRPPVVRVDDDVQLVWHGNAPRKDELARNIHWQGRLFSQAGGEYRLHVFVHGSVAITVNGENILTVSTRMPAWHESRPIKLAYGYHPLEIGYDRPSTSDAGTIKLCWSGPQFGVEPIPERHFFHEPAKTPPTKLDDGKQLVRALRCAACHDVAGETKPLPAPALTHLEGNLATAWLVDWLTTPAADAAATSDPLRRRMPHLPLSRGDAEAIAVYLFSASQSSPKVTVPKSKEPPPAPPVNPDSKKKPKPRTEPYVRAGEKLARSVGCLACHRVGSLGGDGLFAGTDLTQIATKRSPEFFVRWLDDAKSVNADHRMPKFNLEPLERADLAVYLMTLGRPNEEEKNAVKQSLVDRGRTLVTEHRCASCHRLPGEPQSIARSKPLNDKSNWSDGCLGPPHAEKNQTGPRRPGYMLDETRRKAIVEYLSASEEDEFENPVAEAGRFVMVEWNCVGCHVRGLGNGLAEKVPAITAADAELGTVQAALVPPALHGVGDKLTDEAFLSAVKSDKPPRRPWLRVRMPKFDLSETETKTLAEYVVDHDRVPDRPPTPAATSDDVAQRLAARRLVTADGFGCTSCHKIGKSEPAGTIALAAMGTDLSLLGERIRKPWFDRWVRNPARIIPRMEMPAVQLAVRGVLHDDVNEQLAAVWNVLNEPGFTPPLPNPVRIVRSRNVPGLKEPPHVLTDVFVVDGETYVSPIVIGLPNRHNILFDLEHNRLAAWWTGDTALERTKGKSWYWEPGGAVIPQQVLPKDPITEPRWFGAKSELLSSPAYDVVLYPLPARQNLADLNFIARTERSVNFSTRLIFEHFSEKRLWRRHIVQKFMPIDVVDGATYHGFRRRWEIPPEDKSRHDFLRVWRSTGVEISADKKEAYLPGVVGRPKFVLRTPGVLEYDGEFIGAQLNLRPEDNEPAVCEIDYLISLPLDAFPNDLPALPNPPPLKIDVVPGYEAVWLPLPAGEMPTGLGWMSDGALLFASLKGRVFAARDTNGDGLEDTLAPLSDDLATPYGLAAAMQGDREVIDVITKSALVRLHDDDRDGFYERQEIVADGWGHTDDYHDWAVGLPSTGDGGYFVALPCMQDDRDEAKARLRGQALKLTPREPTKEDPRRFKVEPFCGGLRFPMGLAVDRHGELFATDNQGNYNPFNELNHLQAGKRFGFINKNERSPDFHPPTESPAVEIPHPWTRSVNGICFLDTPEALRAKSAPLFGPFEGHLLGCEFNQRALIRMSLEKVDGVTQGAAYPLSIQPDDPNVPTFEGPNVVAVAPDGDIYVGNLRDSGWGGGQNTGSIVRLVRQGDLPLGIAEVRAEHDGFTVLFTGPVDAAAAKKKANYVIERYRRESTPQYGGDDIDRGTVRVKSVEPATDGRSVRLHCEPMVAGFVYELHLENFTPPGTLFFPDEAHYTMKRLPKK